MSILCDFVLMYFGRHVLIKCHTKFSKMALLDIKHTATSDNKELVKYLSSEELFYILETFRCADIINVLNGQLVTFNLLSLQIFKLLKSRLYFKQDISQEKKADSESQLNEDYIDVTIITCLILRTPISCCSFKIR